MDMPWDSRDLQIFGDDDKLIGIPDSIKPSFDKEKGCTLTFEYNHLNLQSKTPIKLIVAGRTDIPTLISQSQWLSGVIHLRELTFNSFNGVQK
jgi:hypothetical protein